MSADAEKENLSPNDDRDIIPSSQGSQLIHEPNTQRLCLELEDETEKFAPGMIKTLLIIIKTKLVHIRYSTCKGRLQV